MVRTIILAGADIDDYAWLRSRINDDDNIICADSGLRHANAVGVKPDIIIGDMDSVEPEMLDDYKTSSKIIHDIDQNSTDLMKALAVCDTSMPIDIYGASGGRADHDFSNILTLMNLKSPNQVSLISNNELRRVVTGEYVLQGRKGDYVGVFPLKPIENFKVSGLQYTPDVLGGPYEFGWNGACNVMVQDTVTISLSSGLVLITHSATNP
jgi:thiamine pyrophosphokinase